MTLHPAFCIGIKTILWCVKEQSRIMELLFVFVALSSHTTHAPYIGRKKKTTQKFCAFTFAQATILAAQFARFYQ
jgi:hypothetical protein